MHFSTFYQNSSNLQCAIQHPWAGEDLSLNIDERDQTIWICILEL